MRTGSLVLAIAAIVLAGCASPPPRPPPVNPDAVRAEIVRLMPAKVENAQGWALDIFAALEWLRIPPTTEHICSVLAVADQESNFQVDPVVPGLPDIARREIEARAASHHVPKFMVAAALEMDSPGGLSYREAHVVMETIAESGKMTSFDLVEVNPTLDIRNTTAELGTELALSALGKSIL